MNLQGAGGVAGGAAALRQTLIDRAMREQAQQQMLMQQQRGAMDLRRMDQADRAQDFNEQLRTDQLGEQMAQHQDAAKARFDTGTLALDEATPAGFLPKTSPIVGRLQMAGALTPQAERPAVDTGPLLPGDTGDAREEGFLKRETPKQGNLRIDNERAAQVQTDRVANQEDVLAQRREAAAQRAADVADRRAAAGGNRAVADELARARLDAVKEKTEGAKTERTSKEESAKTATQDALGLVERLETHPGIGKATGAYEMRGFTQGAHDFNSIRNQLVAALTLPNLGALKGPMSDKDVKFVKELSTRLGDTYLSAEETRRALAEAKTFLQNKIGGDAGAGAPQAPAGWRYVAKPGGGWTAVEDKP